MGPEGTLPTCSPAAAQPPLCVKKFRALPLCPKFKVMGKQGLAPAALIPTLQTVGEEALVHSQGCQPVEPSSSLPLPVPVTLDPSRGQVLLISALASCQTGSLTQSPNVQSHVFSNCLQLWIWFI